VNQKFVDEYLRGRDPIGAAVIVDTKPRTIVGVHRDYLYRDPTQPPRSTILLPLTQDYNADATLVVRTAAEPTAFAPVLRQLIASVDRNIALTRVMTMEQNIQFHFASLTVGTGALLFFAAVALMLAAVGLYTVLAAFVAQRRREFGIRMALGATPRDVRARVLAESTLLTSVGGCVGLALSVGIGSLLRSEVFEINPFDFRLYLAAACGIGLIATFSTLAPALAASRMQPMAALRTE
jgi:putative ABC transport system permease protein